EEMKPESVIRVRGEVRRRPEGTANPSLDTGQVEVAATEIEILSESLTPPFPIEDGILTDETLRLKYRYLDLRRPEMTRALRLRHHTVRSIRAFFDGRGFVDVETPDL